jgi:hypothetical protein
LGSSINSARILLIAGENTGMYFRRNIGDFDIYFASLDCRYKFSGPE